MAVHSEESFKDFQKCGAAVDMIYGKRHYKAKDQLFFHEGGSVKVC